MATNKELEVELNQLKKLMAQFGLGIQEPVGDRAKQTDHIAFGSPQHATFLGILLIESADDAAEREIYTSPTTGKLYCLEDEVAALRLVPGTDPDKAIRFVLRQKVGVFESGPPKVPENALPLWTPTLNPMAGL